MIRIWIDKDTVEQNTTEDGDVVLKVEDIYFFKREEISNEEGYHLELNSYDNGGLEVYFPTKEFSTFINVIIRKLLDYSKTN